VSWPTQQVGLQQRRYPGLLVLVASVDLRVSVVSVDPRVSAARPASVVLRVIRVTRVILLYKAV